MRSDDIKKKKIIRRDPGDGRPIESVTFRCGCKVTRQFGGPEDGERYLTACERHGEALEGLKHLYPYSGQDLRVAWIDWVWQYGQDRVWVDV